MAQKSGEPLTGATVGRRCLINNSRQCLCEIALQYRGKVPTRWRNSCGYLEIAKGLADVKINYVSHLLSTTIQADLTTSVAAGEPRHSCDARYSARGILDDSGSAKVAAE